MKNIFFCSALLLVSPIVIATTIGENQSTVDGQAKTCPDSGLPQELTVNNLEQNVEQTRCEMINERNTCSNPRNIDERKRELLTKSFTALDEAYQSSNGNLQLRNNTSSLTTDIQAQIPDGYIALTKATGMIPRNGARLEEINHENYRQAPRGTNIQLRSYYHEFLKRSGNQANFSEHKDNFVNDYLEFEQEFECQRGVEVGLSGTMGTAPVSVAKDAGMQSCETDEAAFRRKLNANRAKFTEHFDSVFSGQNGLDRGLSCDNEIQVRSLRTVAYEQRSCAGRFEQLFRDNEWDMDISSLSSDPEYNKFKECIDKMQAEGFVLTNVSINSSSSQLNNTGNAGSRFCSKGFLELSTARAESARNLLASNFSFPSDSISINPRGRNGNGSSGECPYHQENGREVLKPEYQRGGSARSDLDDAKYVKVSVNFEPKSKPAQNERSCFKAYVNCSKITYKCGEWSRADSTFSQRQAYKRRRDLQASEEE